MKKLWLFLVVIIMATIFYQHSDAQQHEGWQKDVELYDNHDSLIKNGWTYMFSTKLNNKVMFENYYYSCVIDTGVVHVQTLQLYTEYGKKNYHNPNMGLEDIIIVTRYNYYIDLGKNNFGIGKIAQTYFFIWSNKLFTSFFYYPLDQIGFRRPESAMEVQLVEFFKTNYL